MIKKTGAYLFNVLYSFDQFCNSVLGGRADHTISGRVGYWAREGNKYALFFETVINGIFFWDDNHCRNAIEMDEMNKPK